MDCKRKKTDSYSHRGSHSKTIIFGLLSMDGKQLFRQYNRFDSHSFIRYLEKVKKKFKRFIIFVDRATQHRSKVVQEYLQRNEDSVKIEYFPVGSPEFNAVEKSAGNKESTIYCQIIILVFLNLNKQYLNITEQQDLTWILKSIY
jgi:DDE superfamily endonuclease